MHYTIYTALPFEDSSKRYHIDDLRAALNVLVVSLSLNLQLLLAGSVNKIKTIAKDIYLCYLRHFALC